MNRLSIYLLSSLFLLTFLGSEGQGLNLQIGDRFELSQSLTQNTLTDASNTRGNVSLDIRSSVLIEVSGLLDSSAYQINCQYKDLSLSLLSPDMEIVISSSTRSYSSIMKYLTLLEDHRFEGVLASTGELISISNLDEHIISFYEEDKLSSNEQDIIIKTLKEAFGEDAFEGFINLTLNMYCNKMASKCKKDVSYSFNAKPITLHNTFYMQNPKDGGTRIQGIGAITANEDKINFEGGSITTNLNGTQTFDHLFDSETGWLIEGNSKQKIYLVTVFHGKTDLPEGLEVPSLTETEYIFKGAKIEVEN